MRPLYALFADRTGFFDEGARPSANKDDAQNKQRQRKAQSVKLTADHSKYATQSNTSV